MIDDESKRTKGALPASRDRSPLISRISKALFAKLEGEPAQDSLEWQDDLHRAVVEQQPLRARKLMYVIGLTFAALVAWAAVSKIDEVTRGAGQVIPSGKIQVIQSQDGGVITEILVSEGDRVQKGELLVSLDQTRSQSSEKEMALEYQALRVRETRLMATVDKTEFSPDAELTVSVPRIVAQERAIFESSMATFAVDMQIAQFQLDQRHEQLAKVARKERQLARSLYLTDEELSLTRPMVESGAVSRVEILRLEKEANRLNGEHGQAVAELKLIEAEINEASSKLDEVDLEFEGDTRRELSSTLGRINSLREALAGLSDRVRQTAVRSPVNGIVSRMRVNTIGGVVLQGSEMLEVVPEDDTLLLEVRVSPRDIGFLVPGQRALVKLSAYDFITYGQLEAVVEQIGADTVTDEQGEPYYKITVRTNESSFGEGKPIISGMVAEVDIITGKKTVLSYLLKPILKAKQYALSER